MNIARTQRSRLVSTGLSLLSIVSLTAAVLLLAAPVLAQHNSPGPAVTPSVVAGNPACDPSYVEVKFEDDKNEIFSGSRKDTTVNGGAANVVLVSTDGFTFTFDVDGALAAHVLVKGGNNANHYDYTSRPGGGLGHDDGLVAPMNGGANQAEISHISFCLISEPAATATASPSPSTSASASASQAPGDDASLNIRKVNENGQRLAGAVFTIAGMQGTFTTDADGKVCVTGLPDDSIWTVTEIQAPPGYSIADPASQQVQVDDDGDCNSPDAVFVNAAATPTTSPSESPSQSPSESPSLSPSPSEDTQGGNPTPTPREDTQGGNPTPTPGGDLPDTATGPVTGTPATLLTLVMMAALAGTVYARLAEDS